MSIDIKAEIKLSRFVAGEYTVRLRDADETLIGSVRSTPSGWNAYDLENRPLGGNGTTRHAAAAHVLEAYELANGLRDSEGRRVGKDPETKGYWVVLSPIGTKQSPRWTDKADAIAHLASLNSLAVYKLVSNHTDGPRVRHFASFEQAFEAGQATDPEKDGSMLPNLSEAVMAEFGGTDEEYEKGLFWLRSNRYAAIYRKELTGATAEAYRQFFEFEEIGRQAALNDEPAAPISNEKVREALQGRMVGDPVNTRIMEAFSKGYQAVRDEQAAEVLADAEEDDGFKLGVVAPADWDRYDHRCCIEAGEHRGYTRHTKAECRVEDDVNPVGEEPDEPVEFSDRARYVTEQVSLWIQNDGEHIAVARAALQSLGVETLAMMLQRIVKDAPDYSAAWQVGRELAPNDWGRIHWNDVAEALRDQENEEAYDMPLTGQDTTFYHDDEGANDPGTPGGGALPH